MTIGGSGQGSRGWVVREQGAMMDRSRNRGGKRCYVYTLMRKDAKAKLMWEDHSVMRVNDEAK